MNVLSLFNGMSCGRIAFEMAQIPVEEYYSYEIDKYCNIVAQHNYPDDFYGGDVFKEDFTKFHGKIDFLIGGSPCTYWSIAQKNNRETEASGQGWELFSQFVRALREVSPLFFIYENNKSMSKAIKESISNTFGFDPICINSALVSAQNRNRLYWVGRKDKNGKYVKVNVEQPEDRKILLKDILQSGLTWKKKQNTIDANYFKGGNFSSFKKQSGERLCVAEYVPPVRLPQYSEHEKSRPLNSHYSDNCGGFEHRMFSPNPKKQQVDMVAVPINITPDGKSQTIKGQYVNTSPVNICGYNSTYGASGVAEPVRIGSLPRPNGELSESQAMRIYSIEGKSVTQGANGGGMGAKTGLYAVPIEFNGDLPLKAISPSDNKEYTVYTVKDNLIQIKDKKYPITLNDGYYIIRKLTVNECKRLQTIPEWFDMSMVSDTQCYKMLGNGWTVQVIVHLLNSILEDNKLNM